MSEKLVDLARERMPQWSDRFFVGDALTWSPPMLFDFVRTELVYVLDDDRPRYVKQLMTNVVAPGGRLIVCSYGSARRPEPRVEPIAEMLRGWGYDITDQRDVVHTNGVVMTRVACVDRDQS
jgi:SAM-dependent methyltransferase